MDIDQYDIFIAQASRIKALRDNTLAIIQNDRDDEYSFLHLYLDQLTSIYEKLHNALEEVSL